MNQLKEKILKYLKNACPNKKDLQINEFCNITNGWETEIFSFIIVFQENGNEKQEELILRMYLGNFAENKAVKEYKSMKKLFEAKYPVPEPLLVEKDSSILGKPFMMMEKIDGENMGKRFLIALETSDQEIIDNMIIPKFCELFINLHDLDWTSISDEKIKHEYSNPYSFIVNHLSNFEKKLDYFNKGELRPIIKWLTDRIINVPCYKMSVIHQDFHPHNILITKNEEYYVIDWSSCRIGDFRLDLGWTLLLTYAFTSKEIRDKILSKYENLSREKVEEIEFFEVLAICRRLFDISISFSQGAEELGMRKEAVEKMKESGFHIKKVYSLLQEKTGISIKEIENLIIKISE